jgi:hypothetical protein
MGLFSSIKKIADKVGGVVRKVAKSPIIMGAISMIPVVGGMASKGLQFAAAKVDANIAKARAQGAAAEAAKAGLPAPQQPTVTTDSLIEAAERSLGAGQQRAEGDPVQPQPTGGFMDWVKRNKKIIIIAAVPLAILPIVLYFLYRKKGTSSGNVKRRSNLGGRLSGLAKARAAKAAKARRK